MDETIIPIQRGISKTATETRDRLQKFKLAAKSKALDELLVTLFGLPFEVIEKLTALSHHREQSATAGEVFFMLTHVLGEMLDTLSKKRNLVIGATSVLVVLLVVFRVDFSFCTHGISSVPDQLLAGRPLCGRRGIKQNLMRLQGLLLRNPKISHQVHHSTSINLLKTIKAKAAIAMMVKTINQYASIITTTSLRNPPVPPPELFSDVSPGSLKTNFIPLS